MAAKRPRLPFQFTPLWYFKTPLFWHYHELCVSSYPSPLDENAPLLTRTVLAASAGAFDYFAHNGFATIFAILCCLLRKVILLEPRISNPENFTLRIDKPSFSDRWLADPIIDSLDLFFWLQAMFLRFLFLRSFWSRRKAFANSLVRQYPEITTGGSPVLFGFASLLLWYNPVLVYHAIETKVSSHLSGGHRLLVINMMTRYTQFLSPPIAMSINQESPHRQLAAWETSVSVLLSLANAYILKGVIKHIPRVLIAMTLKCQNRTYFSSESSASTAKRKIRKRKLVYQYLCQFAWDAVASTINLAFFLPWKIFAVIYRGTVRLSQYAFNQRSHRLPEDLAPSSSRIRLLHIQPGFHSDPIVCHMQWYDTDSATKTPYTAVSYCWGSDSLCREITVNGNPVLITRSAFAVLRSLRLHHSSKAVWIDAICIDQRSDEDKSRQIPLMPTIYRGAAKTVVWLGNLPTSDLAIALIERAFLVDRINKLVDKTWLASLVPSFEISRASAAAFRHMLDLSYFQRAWVVQEIVRSKNVVVMYGSSSISWQRLSWFTEVMLRNGSLLEMINQRCGGKLQMDSLRNIQTMNRFLLIGTEPQSLSLLFYLVQMFRGTSRFQAKETKDRIYALLGLQNGQASIKPDYDKTDHQLYIEVAQKHLSEATHALDLLAHAGLGYYTGPNSLPSWVPDWSLNPIALPILGTNGITELVSAPHVNQILDDAASFTTYGERNSLPTPQESALETLEETKDTIVSALYKAGCPTSKTSPEYRVTNNDNVLEVRGHVVDEIYCVGKTSSLARAKTTEEIRAFLPILGDWARMVRQICALKPFYTDTKAYVSREVAFMRTLLGNFNEAEMDLTFTSAPTPRVLEHDRAASVFHTLCWLPSTLPPTRTADEEAGMRELVELFRNHAPTWTGKVFGLTKNRYFGLFLKGTRAGDVVSVVYGVGVPLVLRQVSRADQETEVGGQSASGHQLVGPAYVHGFMDGEAMATIGRSARTFYLL
jgi:hypothetical protein